MPMSSSRFLATRFAASLKTAAAQPEESKVLKKRLLFFELADPKKRAVGDIR